MSSGPVPLLVICLNNELINEPKLLPKIFVLGYTHCSNEICHTFTLEELVVIIVVTGGGSGLISLTISIALFCSAVLQNA